MRRWPARYSSSDKHLPVLVDTIVEQIGSCPEGVFVDATVGAGGHLLAVFKAYGERFRYYGFDLDGTILKSTSQFFAELGIEAELVNQNFSDIADFLRGRGIESISAILYDLGIGSFQIDNPQRGFSYLGDGPLSMAFDKRQNFSATDVLEEFTERELAELFYEYGEEPKAKSIARAIKRHGGRISTTGELADLIRKTVGQGHFVKSAARVFQALRIKVNNELYHIEKGLESIIPLLKSGGKVLVISYHSLEDRIVKRLFKKYSGKCVCPPKTPVCHCGKIELVRPVFSKPLRPDNEEIAENSRARSARLRVAERIGIQTQS